MNRMKKIAQDTDAIEAAELEAIDEAAAIEAAEVNAAPRPARNGMRPP